MSKPVKELITSTRQEEGNISTEQEHKYIMVKQWKDETAAQAHNTSAHFQAFVQQAVAFMAAAMNVEVFSGAYKPIF
ncbi:putative quinol monooxygenase [Paenibacillus baimaensis]|uniref:putative quinol monooxygenase n=1 Tax=Paenibacillus baimaensis TaxID=2982185 RepID=UPI0038CD480C